MKHLLATTAILLTAGIASAEVTTTGTARMGIVDGFDSDAAFSSRFRVIFTASGESDTGFAFGATVRNDQSGVGNEANNDSSVYISGSFGKLSMGDVDGAAAAAVGQVSGVGYTGLSDLNEIAYLLGNEDTSILYEYATGDLGLYLSAQPNAGNNNYGLGASYKFGNYKVAIGYEELEDGSTPGGGWPDKLGFSSFFGNGATQIVLGANATFGPVTAKVAFARYDEDNCTGCKMNQAALSVDYAVDALTVTGYYSNFRGVDTYEGDDGDYYGIGASYDLGGGAAVSGGYVRNGTDDTNAIDLGLTFSF